MLDGPYANRMALLQLPEPLNVLFTNETDTYQHSFPRQKARFMMTSNLQVDEIKTCELDIDLIVSNEYDADGVRLIARHAMVL